MAKRTRHEIHEEMFGGDCGFVCEHKESIMDDIIKSDSIRDIVVHEMSIYDTKTIRDVLMFLGMYPADCTVYEVVSDIAAYHEEIEND